MGLFCRDIAVSLVDDAFIFAEKGQGKPLVLPAYLAAQAGTARVLAVGQEAFNMLNRTPANIMVVRVVKEGRVVGQDVAGAFLRYGIRKMLGGSRLFRPRVLMSIRGEGNAKWEAHALGQEIGVRGLFLVEVGMATAIGMGLEVSKPELQAVLTVSDDWFDFSVISLAGVLSSASGAVGTRAFVEDIQNHCTLARNFLPDAQEVEARLLSGGLNSATAGSVSGWEVWAGRTEQGKYGAGGLTQGDVTAGMMPSLVRMTERIKHAVRGLKNDEQAQLSRAFVHATGSAMRIPGLSDAVACQIGYAVKLFPSDVHPSIEGARALLKELEFLRRPKQPGRIDIS